MDNELKALLFDILNAVMEIESFFTDLPKEFEIIYINYFLLLSESIIITNSRKIVDVRNIIIHGYDAVSDDIIWGIVIKHLPILQIEVEELLSQ